VDDRGWERRRGKDEYACVGVLGGLWTWLVVRYGMVDSLVG
jgi:hypothetical protein